MRKRLRRLLRTGRWRRTIYMPTSAAGISSVTVDGDGLLPGDRIVISLR